jgi:serine/threonine-protein kinase
LTSAGAAVHPGVASGDDGGADAGADIQRAGCLLHFRIAKRLGEGGMGVVYQAFDEKLRRVVAVKVLLASYGADERRRLFREARSAAAVTHPNIAAVYEVHEEAEPPFLVMELVEGHSLRALMHSEPLAVEVALSVGAEIAQALAAAHAAGVVHRDLKPENVMISRVGGVKLLDFGVAKIVDAPRLEGKGPAISASLTRSIEGSVVGTPEYMSPEQAIGELVDARADLFALGVVLYEMLAGQRPFRRATVVQTLIAVSRDDPPPLAELNRVVPASVTKLVHRCLAKNPADRPSRAAEVAEALRAGLTEDRTARSTLGARAAVGTAAAAIAMAAATGLWLVARTAHAPAPSSAEPLLPPIAASEEPSASGAPSPDPRASSTPDPSAPTPMATAPQARAPSRPTSPVRPDAGSGIAPPESSAETPPLRKLW